LQTRLETAAGNRLQIAFPKITIWHCSDYTLEFTMSNNAEEIKGINNFKIFFEKIHYLHCHSPKNQQNFCHGKVNK